MDLLEVHQKSHRRCTRAQFYETGRCKLVLLASELECIDWLAASQTDGVEFSDIARQFND